MRLDRRLLYAAATSDRLEALVGRVPPVRRGAFKRARKVVGGTSQSDALATITGLIDDGFTVSVDLFGENVDDHDAVAAVVDDYRSLARAVAAVEGDVDIEIVPSHLGIDVSVEFFCDQVHRIAAALPAGARLQISAEEHHRTARIVAAEERLATDGVAVVATLQANLHRTETDARRLAGSGAAIRLVKGAYVESPAVAYPWGEATDIAFVRLAHQIHAAGANVAIATHDPVIREALLAALDGLSVEMLLGIRADDARELVRRGHHVRLYVPYGTNWFRYWARRVAESRGA